MQAWSENWPPSIQISRLETRLGDHTFVVVPPKAMEFLVDRRSDDPFSPSADPGDADDVDRLATRDICVALRFW